MGCKVVSTTQRCGVMMLCCSMYVHTTYHSVFKLEKECNEKCGDMIIITSLMAKNPMGLFPGSWLPHLKKVFK